MARPVAHVHAVRRKTVDSIKRGGDTKAVLATELEQTVEIMRVRELNIPGACEPQKQLRIESATPSTV